MADILGDLGIARNLCVRATMPPLDTVDSLLSRAIGEIIALRERRDDLLRSNNEFEQRRRDAAGVNKVLALRLSQTERMLQGMTSQYMSLLSDAAPPVIARPIDEYDEDMGAVLWWKFPIIEPPYVGTPNDIGIGVEIVLDVAMFAGGICGQLGKEESLNMRRDVGGWPGYHTHFTPIPVPQESKP